MPRVAFCLGLGVLVVVMTQEETALAERHVRPVAEQGAGPLLTSDGILQDRLTHIARRSPLWRASIASLVGTGRRVFVLTPDEVVVADAPDGTAASTFDPTVVAATAPVPEPGSQVHAVLVVVNLPLIEGAHRQRGSLPAEFLADLDRILVHEIYGHALPYLLAGDLSGQCPDPAPGEPASDACSIRRENAVRAELRLGRRTSYGLTGLALARGSWN